MVIQGPFKPSGWQDVPFDHLKHPGWLVVVEKNIESIDQPIIGHNSQVSNLLLVPGLNAVSPFNG